MDLSGIEAFVSLELLFCSNNQIQSLDLSNNSNLFVLFADNNALTELNFQNGNNTNTGNFDFNITGNINLLCV
ncbi:hypothetical protein, partial [Flagellimonas beolgyonensis]|uniref:hypothetical protein n=1 Tax=Flagellimonas beolgyonensis TaxID=864064 RepID=UPI003D64F805